MGLLVVFMVLLASLDVLLQNALSTVVPLVTILPMMAYVVLVLLTVRSNIKLQYLIGIGIGLGILFEVMYSHTQYIYVLAYIVPLFMTRGIAKLVSQRFIAAMLATLGSVAISQFIVFGYFYLNSQPDILTFLAYHLVPTVIANLLLMFVVYPVVEMILKVYRLSRDNQML